MDVTELYSNASGTTNLVLRFIPEQGGGINSDDGVEISAAAELFVGVTTSLCGDGICDGNETPANCPLDCDPT
jgi:hypothetical protein